MLLHIKKHLTDYLEADFYNANEALDLSQPLTETLIKGNKAPDYLLY